VGKHHLEESRECIRGDLHDTRLHRACYSAEDP
jgi:hypothetical protein